MVAVCLELRIRCSTASNAYCTAFIFTNIKNLHEFITLFEGVLVRILTDKAADMINLKISKVGGLTKARAIRDLAVASGIPMNIEDTW